MPSGLFITGTGTNVGKTFVSKVLYDYLLSVSIESQCDISSVLLKKQNIFYLKPIQTGIADDSTSDLTYVYGSHYTKYHIALQNQSGFLLPCSPHLACTLDRKNDSNNEIELESLSSKIINNKYFQDSFLLIEGAGGVIVPVNQKLQTMLDFMELINFPVIVVASGALGSINETCLTINAIKARGINCAGFIFNDITNTLNNGDCSCGNKIKIDLFENKINHIIAQIEYYDKGQNVHTHKDNLDELDLSNCMIDYSIICQKCLNRVIFFDNAKTIENITKSKYLGFINYNDTFDKSNHKNNSAKNLFQQTFLNNVLI